MTKTVKVGKIKIGGGNPVSVQSMTNTDTADYEATISQLNRLKEAGCDIARLAVRNEEDAKISRRYVKECSMPLVADIQFDYKLAVLSADAGYAKIRFNPGNTPSSHLFEVVSACKANGCPIRVGINGGSLESDLKAKYGLSKESLTESALRACRALEVLGFDDIVISVKASDVRLMKESYELLSEKCGYPLHLGVTEAGEGEDGIIKSAAGLSPLLLNGIGDTVRVSLTGDPVKEVITGRKILNVLGLRRDLPEVVSCPTCARCFYDLESMVKKCKDILKGCSKPLKIAVMGCVVNGPGEAGDADIGIAGGKEKSVIFKKGKIYKTLPTEAAEETFVNMLRELI